MCLVFPSLARGFGELFALGCMVGGPPGFGPWGGAGTRGLCFNR